MAMSSSERPCIVRTRHKLRFVALCPAIGIVTGGMVWLVAYDSRYTPAIGIDGNGPSFLGMILALTVSWLVSTSIGFILYMRGNQSRKMLQAAVIGIFCGLVVGLSTGWALTEYARSHYSPFCERHTNVCRG